MKDRKMRVMESIHSTGSAQNTQKWTSVSEVQAPKNSGLYRDYLYIINGMGKIFPVFLAVLMFVTPLGAVVLAANDPVTESTPSTAKTYPSRPTKTSGVITVHKPQIDPSWGKVLQYHREQVGGVSDKNRETLHEFLFQDEQGIIRTAIFHENASGNGYWEVWVWDQP